MPNDQSLVEITQTLQRIEGLLTAIVARTLKDSIDAVLKEKAQRLLYENTGKVPVKKLAKMTGLSTGTISRTWQEWEQTGLLIKDGKQYKKVIKA